MSIMQDQEYVELVAIGDSSLDNILSGRIQSAERKKSPIERRIARMKADVAYRERTMANIKLLTEFYSGNRPLRHFQQALTTSDFATLFADTLDRSVIMGYERFPKVYDKFLKVGSVQDFRAVDRYQLYGGQDGLTKVPEGGTYRESSMDTASYTFQVAKYGKLFKLTMETLVNDDLDAFRALPDVMAEDAAMSEQKYATSLYAANTTLFNTTHAVTVAGVTTNYSNISTKTLTLANLKVELIKMAGYVDTDGNPVFNTPVFLVVGPALEMTALEILTVVSPAAIADVNIVAIQSRLQVIVDPFLPIVDTTNGATSWYLFAAPTARRYAAEIAFLKGHETPQVFIRDSDSRALGGGNLVPDASFDADVIAWKVRHVWGGSIANAIGGWRYALWSNGTVA